MLSTKFLNMKNKLWEHLGDGWICLCPFRVYFKMYSLMKLSSASVSVWAGNCFRQASQLDWLLSWTNICLIKFVLFNRVASIFTSSNLSDPLTSLVSMANLSGSTSPCKLTNTWNKWKLLFMNMKFIIKVS